MGHAARRRHVVYRSLEDARTALSAAQLLGVGLVLRTAPGALAYAGAPYLKRVAEIALDAAPGADVNLALDCGPDGAAALAGLRAGWPAVVCAGRRAMGAKIADIATQLGARCHTRRPPALDLDGIADPFAACLAWLERGERR